MVQFHSFLIVAFALYSCLSTGWNVMAATCRNSDDENCLPFNRLLSSSSGQTEKILVQIAEVLSVLVYDNDAWVLPDDKDMNIWNNFINSPKNVMSKALRKKLKDKLKIEKVPDHLAHPVVDSIESAEIVDFRKSKNEGIETSLRMLITKLSVGSEKKLFVTFRGTRPEHWSDVEKSVRAYADFTTNTGVVGGRHAGYAGIADQVNIDYFMQERKSHDDDLQIIFTGHSMGGAVANLVALNLLLRMHPQDRHDGNVLAITFGNPAGTDESYSTNLIHDIPNISTIFHSIVLDCDIMPMLMSFTLDRTKENITPFINMIQKVFGDTIGNGIQNMHDATFPVYLHIGNSYVIPQGRGKITIIEHAQKLPTLAKYDITKVGTCHSMLTMIQKLEGRLMPSEASHMITKYPALSMISNYTANYLPTYRVHVVRRVLQDLSRIPRQELNMQIYGKLLNEQFIVKENIRFRVAEKDAKTRETIMIDITSFFAKVNVKYHPAGHHRMITIVATVNDAKNFPHKWDEVQVLVSPYLLPVPLKDAVLVKGSEVWSHASPFNVIQTSFVHGLLRNAFPNRNAYSKKAARLQTLLTKLENALHQLDEETAKQNKEKAISLAATERVQNIPHLHADVLTYFTEFKGKKKELDEAEQDMEDSCTTKECKEQRQLVANLLDESQAWHSMGKIFGSSSEVVNKKVTKEVTLTSTQLSQDMEKSMEKALPSMIFMALQISFQGPLTAETVMEEVKKDTPVAVKLFLTFVVSVGAMAVTGFLFVLPWLIGWLSSGIILSILQIVGGGSFLLFGMLAMNLQEKINEEVMLVAAKDYGSRVKELFDASLSPDERIISETQLMTLQDEEKKVLSFWKKHPQKALTKFQTAFPKFGQTYFQYFIEAIGCLHEMRSIISELKLIGIMGHHSSGKSTFLHTAFELGQRPSAVNAEKTEVVTPYIHPCNENVVLLDFPGADQADQPENTLLIKVAMDLVMMITNLDIQCSSYLQGLLTTVEQSHTPVIIAINKADEKLPKQAELVRTRRGEMKNVSLHAAIIGMMERYLDTETLFLQQGHFHRMEIKLTTLHTLALSSEVSKALNELQTDRKLFRKAFLERYPKENVEQSPLFERLSSYFMSGKATVYHADNIVTLFADMIYPTVDESVDEVLRNRQVTNYSKFINCFAEEEVQQEEEL